MAKIVINQSTFDGAVSKANGIVSGVSKLSAITFQKNTLSRFTTFSGLVSEMNTLLSTFQGTVSAEAGNMKQAAETMVEVDGKQAAAIEKTTVRFHS